MIAGKKAYNEDMSAKVTIMYETPPSLAAFEKHYHSIHLPLVVRMAGIRHAEFSRVLHPENDIHPKMYRMMELYFSSYENAVEALRTPEGRAFMVDTQHLDAPVHMFFSTIE